MFGRTQLRVAAPVALALGALLLAAPGALAAQQVISSDGPLTKIYLNDNLACSADHEGDSHGEFFGGTDPGACGTFLSVGRASYGPAVPADPVQRTPFKPVSQTPVTGAGTATDPLKVVTVVDVAAGLRITQTDTYVVGQESYRSDGTVNNFAEGAISASLYHAGDCFLQGSDRGYGAYDPTTGGVFCALSANNTPPDRIVGFVPVDPGGHFIESSFSTVWTAIDAGGTPFPDSCLCDSEQDNGAGLSWSISVPAGRSVTRSLITTFSPAGVTPGTKPPDTTITDGPAEGATISDTTPSFAFTSDQAGSSFECRVDTATFAACDSPSSTATLVPGRHTFEVRAINSAQEADPTPASRTFTIATSSPPPPPPSGSSSPPAGSTPPPSGSAPPSASGRSKSARRGRAFSGVVAVFTGQAGVPASAYDVTIDWGDGTTSGGSLRTRAAAGQFDVVGEHTYLLGDTYTIRVGIAQRGTGRVALASGSVKVSGPGTVKVGKSFIGALVSGTVRYRRPGATKFIVLGADRQIPIGSLIDARDGRIRITWTTGRPNDVRVVDHYAGIFRLKQKRRRGSRIDAVLAGKLEGCRSGTASAFEARRRRRGRRLWGNGRGGRTTGRGGAATVRGTVWLTQDNCDGSTLVRVRRGIVRVRDRVRRRTVTLTAGQRYTTGKRPLR
jgi:hypothetical protein